VATATQPDFRTGFQPGFRAGTFLRLALPMIVSRAGLAVMSIADGIMVSRYKPVEFAWLSLADGTLGRLLDILIAFLIGGLLLAPRHFARGDREGARQIWRRTVPVSLALGVAGAMVGLFGQRLLGLLGERPELAAGAAPVMAILGAGFPAALVAIAAAVYLEGTGRPQVVAVCVVGANVLNVSLNWLLIGGHFGMAAMGARGSAWSTTIMRSVLGVALGVLAWQRRGPREPQEEAGFAAERQVSRRAQWRLSLGAAASVAALIALSSSLILFAGRLGVLPLAAFSAAWGLAAPAALITMGMADAAGVFVAAEDGRGGLRAAASVAWSSLRLTVGAIAVIALALALTANACAGFYAKDAGMRHSIAAAVPLVALVVVADSVGFIMAASLRAVREAAWPAGIEIAAMLVMVPAAAALAFWYGWGIRGLFLGMLAAGTVRAGMLAWRFAWRTGRGRDRRAGTGGGQESVLGVSGTGVDGVHDGTEKPAAAGVPATTGEPAAAGAAAATLESVCRMM
jgi:MATE family multidrug resistance protein